MFFKKRKDQINKPEKAPTEEEKQQRLDGLFAKFSKTSIGKDILDWAKNNDVSIVIDMQAETGSF